MSWRDLTLEELRAAIRNGQDKGWSALDLSNVCGLDRRDFGLAEQWGGPPNSMLGRSGGLLNVRDPVGFAAWLEERLRTEEEHRARRIAEHGPEAVAGARSRGVNRGKLRRAVKLWTEEAVRWVALSVARYHTGPSGGAKLWEATQAEAIRWVARRSPAERAALLTLWRVSGGNYNDSCGPVVQLMARSGVWRRSAKRGCRGATPPPEEPPPPPPGPSVPAHLPPPPPP